MRLVDDPGSGLGKSCLDDSGPVAINGRVVVRIVLAFPGGCVRDRRAIMTAER